MPTGPPSAAEAALVADPPPDPALLAARCRRLATTEMRGYSPLYEQILLGWADDDELLGRIAPLGDPGKLPVLTLAAVHDLVLADVDAGAHRPADDRGVAASATSTARLAEVYGYSSGPPTSGIEAPRRQAPDVWPTFRRVLVERFTEVAERIATRTVQTNEVGRASALVPALAVVAEEVGQPLALIEVGSSAGLHLLLDRYHHRYPTDPCTDPTSGRAASTRTGPTTHPTTPSDPGVPSWGPADAEVRLTCTLVGPDRPPLPRGPLPLASREGIDLRPVDVADRRQRRWLRACVWPDVPDRADHLRAALEVARQARPPVHAGDVRDLLGPILAAVPDGVVPCVVSSWALAYLPAAGRLAVHDLVAEVGADRAAALVTAEYPRVTPWVPAPEREPAVPAGTGATLLGLTAWRDGREQARPLAWMQAHGRWLDWLDQPG